MTKEVVRYGMNIDSRGKQGSLGYWPGELDDDPRYGGGSFIGRAKQVRSQVLKIGQRHHAMLEEQKRAAFKGEAAAIPDVPARQKQARADLEGLKALRAEYEKIDTEVFDFGLKARQNLFEYKPDLNDALLRQEMRAHLRGLDDKARATALGNFAFRRAAFETVPEVSGLSPMQYERLINKEMSAKFPDHVRTLADFEIARDAVETALKSVGEAVKNESIASGTAALMQQEAKKPTPQPEWV